MGRGGGSRHESHLRAVNVISILRSSAPYDAHTVLGHNVCEDHSGVKVETETGVDQLRLLDPDTQLFSVQRPFSEDQGRGKGRVPGEVSRMELLADDVILENGRDNLLQYLLLGILGLIS